MIQLTFDDAVTAGYLPSNQQFGVYYCDGDYANLAAVRKRLPQATLFAITVFGRTGTGVFACDCEQGDLTPAQAVAWVEEQIKLGVPLICVYASADTWLGSKNLWGVLEHYGPRIKRWVADYNGVKSTTITYNGRTATFDAHQYNSDPRLDYDVAADGFFTPLVLKAKAAPSMHYERFNWRVRRKVRHYDSTRLHLLHAVENVRSCELRLKDAEAAGPSAALEQVVRWYNHAAKVHAILDNRIKRDQAELRKALKLYESGKIKSPRRAWCEGQLRARIDGQLVHPSV